MPARPGGGAGEKANDENELADAEANDLGGADIAAGDTRREAEHGVIDQDVGEHGGDDAEDQTPMHLHAGDAADHIGGADLAASTAC